MSEDRDGLPPPGDDHGDADDEFASVVFDEDFVRSALIHEPTAQERIRAAARARAEAEAAGARLGSADDDADDAPGYEGPGAEYTRYVAYRGYRYAGSADGEHDDGGADEEDRGGAVQFDGWRAPHRHRRPYGGHSRWQRLVAWLLAVVMGMGVVALTFAAVYRGASVGGSRQPFQPPASGRVDAPTPTVTPAPVGSAVTH